ncbi:hypothetical protein ACFQ48_19170 [Hymenobacter caeli]|uniref:Uncharacterized protein n=1 Tax=Hymenobacter caeli TaxID=2735894 RepID=A0ABX2FX45_9BACT|nr:hypothetical protein [Hymenobacter caeli]NRT21021.1 hypothetical protein [Hymenobacter caeli]
MTVRLIFLLLVASQRLAGAQPAPPPAPASPLPRLLAERRALTQHYAAARAQHNGLFGLSDKPSKKDLQAVVDALQGIVNKDEQIVAVLNQTAQAAQATATTVQATSRTDRNTTGERLAELQSAQLNAQEREKQTATDRQLLEADLQEAQLGRLWRDGLIAGLGLACAVLLWRRRRR